MLFSLTQDKGHWRSKVKIVFVTISVRKCHR